MLRNIGPADGWGLLPAVIEAFVQAAPGSLSALRGAVTAGDPAAVEALAHRLRGSAGNLGAGPVATACGQLEALGGAGSLLEATDLLDQVETELASACAVLSGVLAQRSRESSSPTTTSVPGWSRRRRSRGSGTSV